jgi:Reverse transcriptase (RNA-dependent DNA polymerase)
MLSDHFPVITFCDNAKHNSTQFFETRFLNERNINSFKLNLSNLNWNDVIECQDTQLAYETFLNNFLELYNIHFPLQKVKLNRNVHKLEPWFTSGLLVSRRNKMLLSKRVAKVPNIENKSLYKRYRNMYNTIIRASKKLYFENALEKHQSNLKVTWDILRKAIRKVKAKKVSINCILSNGNNLTNYKEIANCFNSFFTTIANEISDDIHPTVRPPEYPFNPDTPLFNITNNPITNFEILTTFTELNSKKSEDYNGLSMYFLKNITLHLLKPLNHVFNLSFINGIVPNQLKIAKVVPIFKSGDPLLVDNYRPISLLSNFSKVLEKIMCKRLTQFLEDNRLISKNQYGFRKNHSTIHPIIHLLNEVAEASNHKKYTLAIFCDLRKAFDTCDHTVLIKKLNKMGVRGIELQWFISYLDNRTQFVCINGENSDRMDIKNGVPQGSILGPLLFLIYINDLPECSLLITLLFADDTTLLASGDNLIDLIHFVNIEFQKVVSFFRSHKMALHPKKTKYIIFNASEQMLSNHDLSVFINSNNENEDYDELKVNIERISLNSEIPAIKFLGVFLDPKLNFKYHVSKLANKISRSLYVIQMSKNVLTSRALKSLYYALIHSNLMYGLHIWSSAPVGTISLLEKLQKKAIRIINLAPYNSHTEPLFKKSEILPLKNLIEYFKVLFMYDYKNNLLPLSFANLWPTNAERRNQEREDARQLRDDHLLAVPFIRLEQYFRFPLSDLPRTWNTFSQNIVAPSRNIFKCMLKEHYLSLLSNNVLCTRMLCPVCHL